MVEENPVNFSSHDPLCGLVCQGVMASLLHADFAASPSFMDPVLDWPREETIPSWH
jgi:hypothetical protein